jgi:predicted aconitase with swiveling domain
MSSSTPIVLPAGVTVGAARETSQTNVQGQVVQGMLFPITLPSGSTTSVFVPYSVLGNTAQVQGLIEQRVNAIMAITGS